MSETNIETFANENNDSYSNDDLYNIISWGVDLSFREIINMYEEDELVKPELQRHYVWDKKEASRFIESILMGLPVPSIFLAKLSDESKLIVDGFQRVMTVYGYVNGLFMGDDKAFKLSNSESINERWRGKTFKELETEDQRRIRSSTIHAIIFEQKAPNDDDTSLHQIFERINTGGRTLTPQEIRNCISQGAFNKLLIDLNNNPRWRELFGNPEKDRRMKDLEFILRFFALSSNEVQESTRIQISLKNLLDRYMNLKENNNSESIQRMEKEFIDVIDLIYENLGINAFHNIATKEDIYIERFHPTIYDSIMIATSKALKNNIDPIKLEEKKRKLLANKDYKKFISERTTNVDHIKGRINTAYKILFGDNDE